MVPRRVPNPVSIFCQENIHDEDREQRHRCHLPGARASDRACGRRLEVRAGKGVHAERAGEIDAELARLGYRCLHRSTDAGNYARGDERVDLLYASRPIARRLLANAVESETSLGTLRVVTAEGLIGFKLQALANDPRRTQDLEDIRALLRGNRATLDMAEIREYFRLFERESLLDELLREFD